MPENKDLIKISCYISMLLRHKPQAAGISLDEHGWADVNELIKGVSETKAPLTIEELEYIVDTDDKGRYSFNTDKTLIRANQGHSISVDVELDETEPPEFLWHGTGEKYVNSIDEIGLIPKSRLYVHLSADYETAATVGSRHGNPVVYRIRAKELRKDGYTFFLSKNGVWLTREVPAKYLEKEKSD